MLDTKVKPKEVYIYHHQEYPKWVEHPHATLDSKNKPVLCADADAELKFLYSLTEEGREKVAEEEERIEIVKRDAEKKALKVEEMRKKAFLDAVKQAKAQVEKARESAVKTSEPAKTKKAKKSAPEELNFDLG